MKKINDLRIKKIDKPLANLTKKQKERIFKSTKLERKFRFNNRH